MWALKCAQQRPQDILWVNNYKRKKQELLFLRPICLPTQANIPTNIIKQSQKVYELRSVQEHVFGRTDARLFAICPKPIRPGIKVKFNIFSNYYLFFFLLVLLKGV